ncbi:MAG: transcription termination/antitermination protein NusA, partial [Bryobacterales bacterium]|nr:transcription termination/antitermination protein NusA [Bryobacterales bacterium]
AIVDSEARHMEVIVDDSQLSLAIGKKGQNVRLAAKLLAWRVDIKSQEEKRQEVEMEMSNLVVPGDPVSILLSHGMPEVILNLLVDGGVGTVEALGSMTPEDLSVIPGMIPEYVPMIQSAVLSYYGQFEEAMLEEQAPAAAEGDAPVETVELPAEEALPVADTPPAAGEMEALPVESADSAAAEEVAGEPALEPPPASEESSQEAGTASYENVSESQQDAQVAENRAE